MSGPTPNFTLKFEVNPAGPTSRKILPKFFVEPPLKMGNPTGKQGHQTQLAKTPKPHPQINSLK